MLVNNFNICAVIFLCTYLFSVFICNSFKEYELQHIYCLRPTHTNLRKAAESFQKLAYIPIANVTYATIIVSFLIIKKIKHKLK